jgi:hypothetical protein
MWLSPDHKYMVSDLGKSNVIIDTDGNLRFIDAVFKPTTASEIKAFAPGLKLPPPLGVAPVTAAAEQQPALLPTPPTFGKKPQPATTNGDVSTSDLVDSFTATETVQPELTTDNPSPITPDPSPAVNLSDDAWLQQNRDRIPADLKIPVPVNGVDVDMTATKALELLDGQVDMYERLKECLGR